MYIVHCDNVILFKHMWFLFNTFYFLCFVVSQSYPFLTPGKSMFVAKDVASAFLEVKLDARERQQVESGNLFFVCE